MYAHFYTLDIEPVPPRIELHSDLASTLAEADLYTRLIVLRSDPDRSPSFGPLPRIYLGGTIYTVPGMRRHFADNPGVADALIENYGSCVIQFGDHWLPFRTGDVRYPVPEHVRLERGDREVLHDTDLLGSIRWD